MKKVFNRVATIPKLIAFTQIVGASWIIGSIIGLILLFFLRSRLGVVLGICLSFAGLVFGVFRAIRVWKKEGTVSFISKVFASPDVDEALKNNSRSKPEVGTKPEK